MIEIICIIIAVLAGFVAGHIHATKQWIKCGRENLVIRIAKKYCYEVKYIGINNSRNLIKRWRYRK